MGRKPSKSTQSNRKKKSKKKISENEIRIEIVKICTFVLALLSAVSIYTTKAGKLGEFIKDLFVGTLGVSAYIVPVYVLILITLIYIHKFNDKMKFKFIVSFIIMILLSISAHVLSHSTMMISGFDKLTFYYTNSSIRRGGVVGGIIGDMFITVIGIYGTYILLIALYIISAILLTEQSFIEFLTKLFNKIKLGSKLVKKKTKQKKGPKSPVIVNGVEEQKILDTFKGNIEEPACTEEPDEIKGEQISINSYEKKSEPQQQKCQKQTKNDDSMPNVNINSGELEEYKFPSIDLLKENKSIQSTHSKTEYIKNAKKLETALESFGVKAKVVQVNKGPTVTRYELQPSQGVKVSKIVNLADDIALNLAASGIRIEAPIPGKSVVGIEVPNDDMQSVFLREIIDNDNFKKFPSKVAFGLGKDIDGNVLVTDISKMPHLLIAGATGSGKSVCINSLIVSILYKAHPNDVKLILIDPKVVELSVYNGIPHLLIPVVNDPKKASGALNWAVQEMTTRYKKFADMNVRDIKGFNKLINEKPDFEDEKMPHIVVIIDELADLMMVAPKEVEESICRLAQMARAAGIHLVIATQRPSVDVITGVIKANIPSRLAFAVSSGTDSRTILDMNGAEKLLGKGDMLFMPIGMSKPVRIQGAFISDKEVENIVDAIKQDFNVEYNDNVINEIDSKVPINKSDEQVDEYLEQAIELVVGKQKASISMLQRVFRIGFNRAARIMDGMYERGIVGPEEGSKPRKVIITKEQFEEMKQNS